MTFSTLISVADAAAHLDDPAWLFVDCRFVLGQPGAGRTAYLAGHLAGAVYADLDEDLSGPVVPGETGRHPLPEQDRFAATATWLGVGPDTQVVAYDDGSGALAAARLWWLLNWAGHDAVAVLDGGFTAWRDAGLPCVTGPQERPPGAFTGRFRNELAVGATELAGRTVVDSRAADRYRGENETIDPVAGHIPGARSLPFAGNLGPNGLFLGPAELRERFAAVAGADGPPVFYCGSGVTAAQNVLAYTHAGLGMPALYPGSWSEWITDPARPVETGDPAAS
jgi:thiosulfate/3-mercaptopyruvate sulfurtransferase